VRAIDAGRKLHRVSLAAALRWDQSGPSMEPSVRQQTMLDDFLIIEDPQERLGAVVDNGRNAPPLSAEFRIDENRVAGCQSEVWLIIRTDGDACTFQGDSDSPLVRGLVHLTCRFFSGESTADVARSAESIDPVSLLGLSRNLSSTRINGLAAVRRRIRQLAAAASSSTP